MRAYVRVRVRMCHNCSYHSLTIQTNSECAQVFVCACVCVHGGSMYRARACVHVCVCTGVTVKLYVLCYVNVRYPDAQMCVCMCV